MCRFLDTALPGFAKLYARLWHGCKRIGPNPLATLGPALVVSNHPCHADAAFLMAGSGRRIHFLQAREYYDIAGLRPFFDWFGCIPVKRGACDSHAIRLALEQLDRGEAVGLFPEGDISPGADQLRRGQSGAAL